MAAFLRKTLERDSIELSHLLIHHFPEASIIPGYRQPTHTFADLLWMDRWIDG